MSREDTRFIQFELNQQNCHFYCYQGFQLIMDSRKMRQKRDERVVIQRMETWKKIFYALFVSLLCFSITKGDPRRVNALKNVEITDERIEYIMDTTIAIQTKTFRQRITAESDGLWKLVPFVDTKKWVDIEVQLKTRIGIKLNSITYDKAYNHVHIDFGGPSVLDRNYKTKIIQTSTGFFSQQWTITSFEQHKDIFLSELIDNQSSNLIDIFKKDLKQVSTLQQKFQNKVLEALSSNYNALDPEVLVMKINQYVLNKVGQLLPSNILPSINSSSFYTKQIANMPIIQQDPTKNRARKEEQDQYGKARRKQRQLNKRQRIVYQSDKDLSQRQKLKKKIFQR